MIRNHIFNICMYEKDLALNNLQGLICHKNQTKPNQITIPDSMVVFPPFHS